MQRILRKTGWGSAVLVGALSIGGCVVDLDPEEQGSTGDEASSGAPDPTKPPTSGPSDPPTTSDPTTSGAPDPDTSGDVTTATSSDPETTSTGPATTGDDTTGDASSESTDGTSTGDEPDSTSTGDDTTTGVDPTLPDTSTGSTGDDTTTGDDTAGPVHAKSMSETVNGGLVASSPNFRMVFTLGQPAQHQGSFYSESFTLQGGLVGAIGEQP